MSQDSETGFRSPAFKVTFCSATVIAPHFALIVNVWVDGVLFVTFTKMRTFWPTVAELDVKLAVIVAEAGDSKTVRGSHPLVAGALLLSPL